MFHNIIEFLVVWKDSTSERQKLQHFYLSICLTTLLIGGVVGLLNIKLGNKIAFLAVLSLGVFLCNAVIWNLFDSIVLYRISPRTKRKK